MIRYIFGELLLEFDNKLLKEVFSHLSRLDVQFRDVSRSQDTFSLYIPLYRKKAVLERLRCFGIEAKAEKPCGFPALLKSYRRRFGIPVGALLAVLLVWLSGRVIWCVNVEGNSSVSDSEIVEILKELGCGIGDTYEDIDFDILHNRFLMECEDIAWIAVNMNGTHANVEVRETAEGMEDEEGGSFNIVALEDGQVERIAAIEGKPVVEINDTVKKGELLISGAISYKETFNRFESALGSVYARVNRSFEVSVPLKQEKKVPTGEEKEKKSLTFFNFKINLFLNSSIPYEFCDKITVNKQISLFDTVMLPLYVDRSVYREYSIETVTLTEEEAREAAIVRYREKLSEVLGDAEILTKTVTEDFDGETYTVRCELYCLADIAKKVPLGLSGSEQTEKINEEETEENGTENSNDTQQ